MEDGTAHKAKGTTPSRESGGLSGKFIWGWGLGLPLAAALVWLIVCYVVPIWQAHAAVRMCEKGTGSVNDLCAAAIGKLGGEQAAARKLTLYLRHRRPSVERRLVLLDILDRCGREHPVPGLVLLLRDREIDASTRAHIVHLLSDEHGGPWSVAPLIEALLKDQDAVVRAEASEEIFFLSEFDEHRVAAALTEALGDTDADVRTAAAETLERLGKADSPEGAK
jgi:HEAT repeat protein